MRTAKTSPSIIATGGGKAKLISFFIRFHEGSNKYGGATFATWERAQHVMKQIFRECKPGGYLKVSVIVTWDNGAELCARVDIGNEPGDFNPSKQLISFHIEQVAKLVHIKQNFDYYGVSFTDSNDEEPTLARTFEEVVVMQAETWQWN